MVIAVRREDTMGKQFDGAVVWGWSVVDGAAPGEQNVCEHAIHGDYIVRRDPWTLDGRRRLLAWGVCRVRQRGDRFRVAIGGGTVGGVISYHRTPEAAVKAAVAMLRNDQRGREAAARAACTAGEPVACPDADRCRHGIDG
jgi:hypothetical protein